MVPYNPTKTVTQICGNKNHDYTQLPTFSALLSAVEKVHINYFVTWFCLIPCICSTIRNSANCFSENELLAKFCTH